MLLSDLSEDDDHANQQRPVSNDYGSQRQPFSRSQLRKAAFARHDGP